MILNFQAWDKNERCIKEVCFAPKNISNDTTKQIPIHQESMGRRNHNGIFW